ncbi:MAG: hypothetical protein ACLQIJ_20685, partial [Polyangia bacterium]
MVKNAQTHLQNLERPPPLGKPHCQPGEDGGSASSSTPGLLSSRNHDMPEFLKDIKRTHDCGALRASDVD